MAEEVQDQDTRFAAGEDQAARVTRDSSLWEVETGDRKGNSCAAPVGGGEIVWGEGRAKEEGEVAVGWDNLIDREGIQGVSDKTMEVAHGGQALSEEFPEEDEGERAGCMKVGRGGRVETEGEEGDRLGKHSRSGHESSEVMKQGHGGASVKIYGKKSNQKRNLRAENVWGVCLSMSNRNGGVCGSDEPRHGNLDRRLSGEMIVVGASAAVAGEDVRILRHKDMVYASRAIADAAVGAAVSIENAGAVAENGLFGERRKELTRRSNWGDSSQFWEVGNWTRDTQKKRECLPGGLEDPEQKREHRKQEGGKRNLDL